MEVWDAYYEYINSLAIKLDEVPEPSFSEIEFTTKEDSQGRIVIYSPLLGESYRLWRSYESIDPVIKYGHAIGKSTNGKRYIINIKTGERHKLFHSNIRFVDDNRIIGNDGGFYAHLYDFRGNILEEYVYYNSYIPRGQEQEELPRKESIKSVPEEGFFRTIYMYHGMALTMRPLLDYDGNIICYKDGKIYLYDSYHDKYSKLCKLDEFDYMHNSIIVNGNRCMLYRGKLIDAKWMRDPDNHIISNKLMDVLTYEEFGELFKAGKHQEEIEKAKMDRDRVASELKEEWRVEKLVEETAKQEQRKDELKKGLEETRRAMYELYQRYADQIAEFESLGDDNPFAHKKVVPITEDILFIEVEGHKEINPFFLDNHLLRYADLSVIDFSNVKLDHVSCLAYTNANIDPQTVFNKDLSFSDLRGIYHTRDNFEGVNMEGAIVDEDKLDFATNLSSQTIINDNRADSFMDTEEARRSLDNDKEQ